MADEEFQRGPSKRQIARLIGGSPIAMYVLSEDLQLVFANEALAGLLHRGVDELIGLDCASSMHDPTDARQRLASWLGLPPNVDRARASMHRIEPVPNLDGALAPTSEALMRIAFPIEEGDTPCILCVVKPDRGEVDGLLFDRRMMELKAQLQFPTVLDKSAKARWYLCGESPGVLRVRTQIQAATSGKWGVHVVGHRFGPGLEIAVQIAAQRVSKESTNSKWLGPPIVIDCALMDADLLRGMFEVLDDWKRSQGQSGRAPAVILQGLDQLSQDLVPMLVQRRLDEHSVVIATSESEGLPAIESCGRDGAMLIACLSAHVVRLPALASRVSEMDVLVAAWLEQQRLEQSMDETIRWSQSFMDAMIAYAWPEDTGEFQKAMEHALSKSGGECLTENHLPASIRTYPSHIRRQQDAGPIDLDRVLEETEKELIARAVAMHPRNRAAAAKQLGISRTRLLRRLQQLGMDSKVGAEAAENDDPIFEEIDDA